MPAGNLKGAPVSERIAHGDLVIARELYDLIATEVIPGTQVTADAFWSAFERIVADLTPRNRTSRSEK